MKRPLLYLAVTLLILFSLFSPILTSSAVLFESYTTGDNTNVGIGGSSWQAMTFTPNQEHNICSVKLKMWRDGTPGTITVSIRATSGGKPTGGDLCSGTTDGDTLPTGAPYEWREITFTPAYSLETSVQYAIVARASDVWAYWRLDSADGTYTGGCQCHSTGGSNWNKSNDGYDLLFEEYGIEAPIVTNDGGADSITKNSALLRGEVTALGDCTNVTAKFYWGETDGGTVAENWTYNVTATSPSQPMTTGVFNYTATSLNQHTIYYYRSYASCAAVGVWANTTANFTTLYGTPSITNTGASPVYQNWATLSGNLTDTGGTTGDTATVKVYYGESDGGMVAGNWSHNKTVGNFTVGALNTSVYELSVNTTHYYRFYVENPDESAWAPSSDSFTTLPYGLPTVVTSTVTDIGEDEATFSCTLVSDGGQPCAIWVAYGPTQSCIYHTGYAIDKVSGESYTETVEGLLPDTQYYYMAVAYKPAKENVEAEITYGTLNVFRTLPAGILSPISTSIFSAKIFKDVVADDDRLIFVRYEIKYNVAPSEPAEDYYRFYITDTYSSPIYYSEIRNYGYGLAAMYLSPEHGLTWNSTGYLLVVSLIEYWDATEGTNQSTYTLSLSDYDTDLRNIKSFVDAQIRYVDTRYLDASGLNGKGMEYCEKVLPGFDVVYPYPTRYIEKTHPQTYSEELAGRWDGTDYGTAINNLATWAGLPAMWLTSILWLGLTGIVCFLVVVKTRSPRPALILAAPMIIGGALIGFMPLVVSIIIAFLCLLGIGYVFFYKGLPT